ncbi:MAG: hypothetical protein ACP5NY_04595 [Thermocladium sp.]
MSNYKVLSIKPLEPLHLGLRNIGNAEEFSIDETAATPLPSTILGMLGNAMDIMLNIDCRKYKENGLYDFEDIKLLIQETINCSPDLKATSSTEPCLWGALIRISNENHVPINTMGIKITNLNQYINTALISSKDNKETMMLDTNNNLSGFAEASTRIGINIGDAGVVNSMFESSYISYKTGLELIYVIREPRKRINTNIIRLGGENRAALLNLMDGMYIPRNGEYAVALQPILIYSEKPAYINEVKGLECVEEIYGIFNGEKFKVRTTSIGLGFSEVCGFRRPILQALPQGTVLKLRKESKCVNATAIGLLSELGYGSIYRVQL